MTALLEGIKSLIRRNEGLADNLSSTEVKHYAAEILNRLRHGGTVEILELYLRQLRTPGSKVDPHLLNSAGRERNWDSVRPTTTVEGACKQGD
jgi:hypothetical protein